MDAILNSEMIPGAEENGFKQPIEPIHFTVQSKKIHATPLEPEGSDYSVVTNTIQCTTVKKEDSTREEVEDFELPSDVPYKKPAWTTQCIPDADYFLEVLKEGCIIDKFDLSQRPNYVFGRQQDCHLQLEHPSISRYHVVLQYRKIGNKQKDEIGWYLYDLGSTHGSFLNKQRLPAHMHIRFKVGHVLKLGGSSRLLILQGPEEDAEPESELTVTEIKRKGEKQRALLNLAKMKNSVQDLKREDDSAQKNSEKGAESVETSDGIDWGMGMESYGEANEQEEENEEQGESIDFEDIQKREQFYIDDPKKALKNFFDRQDFDLNYEYIEKGTSFKRQWHCRVELPIETNTGRTIYAEVTVSGGKKEAAAACALEACRMLDAYGVLRKSNQDSKKRPSKNLKDQDYYDSDEDTYFDRTSELERKRNMRLKRSIESDSQVSYGPSIKSSAVDTYETLLTKLKDVEQEIEKIKGHLATLNAELHPDASSAGVVSERDALDDYMMNMSRGKDAAVETKFEISRLRLRLVELNQSASRYKKLVALAKPSATLPPLTRDSTTGQIAGGESTSSKVKKSTPILTGKIKRTKVETRVERAAEPAPQPKTVFIGEEEIEVDDDEDATAATSALIEKSIDDKVSSAGNILELKLHQPKEHAPVQKTARVEKTSELPDRVETQPGMKKDGLSFVEYDRMNDPDYSVWMPPEDQSGDGRTSLNDKLGY